jgi:hypothetical protein
MAEPTPLEADYYPRLKHNKRWYLLVPEVLHHEGCAFYKPGIGTECRLITENGGTTDGIPLFNRHDCAALDGTIFLAPSKFPEYRAQLVAKKLEGES